jgi:hypothetical protein
VENLLTHHLFNHLINHQIKHLINHLINYLMNSPKVQFPVFDKGLIKNLILDVLHSADVAFGNSNEQIWQCYGAVAFTLIFFSVGLYRIVEFFGLGLKPRLQKALIGLHVVGLVFFSLATLLFGIDSKSLHTTLVGVILGLSMLCLLPTHIYINLIRRVRLREKLNR